MKSNVYRVDGPGRGKLGWAARAGENVVVHCRQHPEATVTRSTAARGIRVPEMEEQRRWLDHYAAVLADRKTT